MTLDAQGRPQVVVTGLGVVSPLGRGRDTNWQRLTAGESGIRRIDRFSTQGLRTTIAGTVDFGDGVGSAPQHSMNLAETAGREAVEQSGLGGSIPGPLFLAVPPVEMEWQHKFEVSDDAASQASGYDRMLAATRDRSFRSMHELIQFGRPADHLHMLFGTSGMPVSLSTACASGATAIQMGVEAIRRGDEDVALCIGTDGSVHIESLVRFSLLSALSTNDEVPSAASRPFSRDRDGFVMAEGAGALVLESLEHANARGATILAVVRGIGEQADDFHRTRSSPDGSPAIGAVRSALADAGMDADELSTINAHGTSTPENDKMEALSMRAVFGDRLRSIPITSNKSMIGHTLTAAGAIEAVYSCLTLQNGVVPPTINYNQPDDELGLDVVTSGRKIEATTVLSNSFGFGGQNACLVFGSSPV